jgi:DNA helicase-2/ATP-dependent DNA helicase PcrA
MKKPIKIYGPPGTGKTFRLIRRVNAYVYVRTGTPYHKIGYFAFTKKAAKEARERIGVDEKQVPYFQTLHAFCFHLLNLNESDIMQPHHYEALGKKLNIRVNFNDKYNEEQTHFLTCNNPYFQMIQRSINKDIPLREEFNLNEHDRKDIDSWDTLKHIHINLQEYKTKMHLLDFNDLVKKVVNSKKFPKLKAIFIDEAQDLSPLQWQLYDKLKENCDDIYLAGDDDQAIFAWAGADVNRFIKEPANERVLRYSRRVSRAVQEQSQIAVSKIAGIRKHKEYLPRAQEGFASHINNLGQIDLTKGKWLILTRTKSNLLDIMKELKSKNIYYQSNKGKSFNVGIYNGAMAYTKWIREGKLEEKEINDVREYIPSGNWNPEKNWYDIFVADQKEILYIRNIISGGEILSENARVWVSTIHAAKGGEEDNVILSLHQGSKVQKSIRLSIDKQDEEHRVWYVGITRARNNLYKLKAKKKIKEYQL